MSSLDDCVTLLMVVSVYVDGSVFDREKRQALLCSSKNPCEFQQKCINGGTCLRNETTCEILCQCYIGYTGAQCETELEQEENRLSFDNTRDCSVDQCLKLTPCSNGGTCMWNETLCSTSCQCAAGYSGDTCDEVNPVLLGVSVNPVNMLCSNNLCLESTVCLNGGSCTQDSKCHIHCNCYPDHTGDFCETLIMTTFGHETATTMISTLQTTTLHPVNVPCLSNPCAWSTVCRNGGSCTQDSKCHIHCNCYPDHTGEHCETVITATFGHTTTMTSTLPTLLKPFKEVSEDGKYWVVGSCAFLVLLLGLLLLLTYFLVKTRNMLLMQVLHYFQPYEDNDGKLFDAFISYTSAPEDDNFVYRTLYPELEKQRGFKLCLHQRDFTPGETITNNIIWAIEKSRRTILVLTPRYLESDFTKFEYQVAFNEMLKQKHMIIPLLLEDLAEKKDIMDRTLTSILKSISYIEWPQDSEEEMLKNFWKRLQLSMPKRKSGSESETLE